MADWTYRLPFRFCGSILDGLLKQGYLAFYWRSDLGPDVKFPDEFKLQQLSAEAARGDLRDDDFPSMEPGDRVAVLMHDNVIVTVEIEGAARPMSDLPEDVAFGALRTRYDEDPDVLADESGFDGTGFYEMDENGEKSYHFPNYFRKVKLLSGPIAKRDTVPGLRARFRILGWSITRLPNSATIDASLNCTERPPLGELMRGTVAGVLLDTLCEYLWSDEFDELVKWYLEKLGASECSDDDMLYGDGNIFYIKSIFSDMREVAYVLTPYKKGGFIEESVLSKSIRNAAFARDHAPKDYSLGPSIVYVTGGALLPTSTDDIVRSAWVITSGEFTDANREEASELGVRLVSGSELADGLLKRGLAGIDEVTPMGPDIGWARRLFES